MKLFFVSLWGWVACISGAIADSFIGDEFSANVDISTDSVVYENVMFRPGVVNVNDTLDFVNPRFRRGIHLKMSDIVPESKRGQAHLVNISLLRLLNENKEVFDDNFFTCIQ